MGKWQGLILGGGMMLVLAGAALALAPGRASGQDSAAVISISPPSTQMGPAGGQFNIEITVANVQNLGAFELTLKYNPEVLDFYGASDTGYLTTTGRAEQCLPATNAADAGIITFGCNTIGLVENGEGKPGPSGSGTLAIFSFAPKVIGKSDLTLVGLDAPYIYTTNDATQHGQTSLDAVETCPAPSQCDTAPIAFTAGTGIAVVLDPAVATPTALAPTPTPQPRASVTPNREATTRAVLGTPERTLGTQVARTGSSGTGTGGGSTSDVAGTAAGPDGVAGTADDGQPALGAAGGVRRLPDGSIAPSSTSGGASGGARGPNGAPIAGYGPQTHENPWPGRAGVTMIILGALVLLGGLTVRGGKPRAM